MTIKIFGCCRVSTNEQKEDRQLQAMLDLGINERDVFIDKSAFLNTKTKSNTTTPTILLALPKNLLYAITKVIQNAKVIKILKR